MPVATPRRFSRVSAVAAGIGLVTVLGACQSLEITVNNAEHTAQHPPGVTITDIAWDFYNDVYRDYLVEYRDGDNEFSAPPNHTFVQIQQETVCLGETCSTTLALNKLQPIQDFYLASSQDTQDTLLASNPELGDPDEEDIFWGQPFLVHENDVNQLLKIGGEGFPWSERVQERGEDVGLVYDMRLFSAQDLCGLYVAAAGADRDNPVPEKEWMDDILDANIANTTIACFGETAALFPPKSRTTKAAATETCAVDTLAKTGIAPGLLLGGASAATLLILGGIQLTVFGRKKRVGGKPAEVASP
jgi:hypothetical protein